MVHAKSLANKSPALNSIPITKVQANALKMAKEQALILAKQQAKERLLAEAQTTNSDASLFQA